jgi:hypothetical protein
MSALMIALLLFGCGSAESESNRSGESGSESHSAPPELADHRWQLTSATNAQGAPIEALDVGIAGQIDLWFFDSYMGWDDNCNGLNGRHAVEGQSLRITGPGLPTTLIGCAPAQERARDTLMHSFFSEMTWSVTSTNGSSTLVLTSSMDGSIATLIAAPK